VINEDRLGLDRVYVQAKRYSKGNAVGRPEVQAFVGSLVGLGATKGVFVTTSTFSPQARDFVRHLSQRVILLRGRPNPDCRWKTPSGRACADLATPRVQPSPPRQPAETGVRTGFRNPGRAGAVMFVGRHGRAICEAERANTCTNSSDASEAGTFT
jgi:Restriction endonuclease